MATNGDEQKLNISEPTGGHGHGEFVLAGPTHNYEYEPDQFAVKTILAVPVAVIITALIAFGITWVLFSNIFDPRIQDPPDNSAAAARNAAPQNDRFGRISSTDPNAEVQQPRLEGLEKTEVYPRDGNKENAEGRNLITSQMSTTQRTKEGNSPKYHADDLRPDRVKPLNVNGPDAESGTTKVPVDEAIKLLVGGKLLPAQEGARRLDIDADWDRPKESNGGNAKMPQPIKPAGPKKADEKKGPDAKEGEKKGAEPEKK
jgi:hypothetical protein